MTAAVDPLSEVRAATAGFVKAVATNSSAEVVLDYFAPDGFRKSLAGMMDCLPGDTEAERKQEFREYLVDRQPPRKTEVKSPVSKDTRGPRPLNTEADGFAVFRLDRSTIAEFRAQGDGILSAVGEDANTFSPHRSER